MSKKEDLMIQRVENLLHERLSKYEVSIDNFHREFSELLKYLGLAIVQERTDDIFEIVAYHVVKKENLGKK